VLKPCRTLNGAGDIPFGKHVGGHTYFHVAGLNTVDENVRKEIRKAVRWASIKTGRDFNVVKLKRNGTQVSFLRYERFFDDPFPALTRSYIVDLSSKKINQRNYERSSNPPILHRKELLLPPLHPEISVFQALTQQLEAANLYQNSRRIGFAREWQKRLTTAGYKVEDHRLVRLIEKERTKTRDANDPDRHKTAISRYVLSAPMQALGRYGYLDGSRTIFDYGCGRGDDLQILEKNGVRASGWDPYFRPSVPKTESDIVNLGYVLNTIENPTERAQVLQDAFSLALCLMSVAVMTSAGRQCEREKYADGLRTQRNTFQRYYSQQELRHYLKEVLSKEPVAVGPGIYLVFKDEIEEQSFLQDRTRNRGGLESLIRHIPKPTRREREETFYNANRQLFDSIWHLWLDLGRKPDRQEVLQINEVEKICGSLGRAINFLIRFHGDGAIAAASKLRKTDLTLYFALQQFEGRQPYKTLPGRLRRDVRVFFGGYRRAQIAGRELLFSAGNKSAMQTACRQAASKGIGWLDRDDSLYVHTLLIERLPIILRAYIGCGGYLYGDVTNSDLIKIHSRSARLTLMRFDDFNAKPLPQLVEQVKVNLQDQRTDEYLYSGSLSAPYLYRKSRFIQEDFPHFAEQVAFEQDLEKLSLFDFSERDPLPIVFNERLETAGYQIRGFHLVSVDPTSR